MKKKKYIAPNEASAGRWIAALLISLAVGGVLGLPFADFLDDTENFVIGIPYADFFGLLTFVFLFWALVLAIRFVGKTSLKDFILGVGGSVDIKLCLRILGLYALGFAIPYLLTLGNLRVQTVDWGQFGFLLLFMSLVAWMQTTWEELLYRGLFLRWACKNKIGYTKRVPVAAVISSLAFAISHVANPEVTSQFGIYTVIAVISYTVPGFMLFLADLHFGNLLPGILIHWLNNFLLFTLLSSKVRAVSVPTLFIDTTDGGAIWSLVSNTLAYLPLLIYILWDRKKRKKAVLTEE